MKMVEIRVKNTKQGFFITAHLNGRQVGEVALLHLRDSHYRVSMLIVNDKHQDKGIGTKLMETAFKLCGSIELGCFRDVYQFYKNIGFKIRKKGRKTYELFWHKHEWSPYARHTSICKKCGTVWFRGRWYKDGKS